RRNRRVFEGMGCSAHEANIAPHENKTRTSECCPRNFCGAFLRGPKGNPAISSELLLWAGPADINKCRKKLHPTGCSECDKMITMPHQAFDG
ncbi:MAG: hypothetical protein JZU55_12845, partial [Afipia sp.]|nr:hypothetical protein [Afipia sp.]